MNTDTIVSPRCSSTWAVRISTLVWAMLLLTFLSSLPILLAAFWLTLPALFLLAAIVVLPVIGIWRRIWQSARARHWRTTWLRGAVGLWFLLCGIAAAPFYYLVIITETRPAIVPTVVMSNGQRTVVMQGMQHVGMDRFYKSVVYDLEQALADGYTLFYEGVADSDPESNKWFRETLSSGMDLGDSYRMLGNVCGLSYQNDFMGPVVADAKLHPERHFTADVTTRDMKLEYDRLMQTDPAFSEAIQKRQIDKENESGDSSDLITRFIDHQKQGNDRQATLAGVVCRGIMTMVMQKSAEDQGDPMNAIVLSLRNHHLASQLLADSRDKIYVTYGAAHLPGVIALMQKTPGWQVKSVKWMRTIAAPEHIDGHL